MGDRVKFRRIDTSNLTALDESGFSNAVFVNDQQIALCYKELREAVEERLSQ